MGLFWVFPVQISQKKGLNPQNSPKNTHLSMGKVVNDKKIKI
jgi:hypothetical protein